MDTRGVRKGIVAGFLAAGLISPAFAQAPDSAGEILPTGDGQFHFAFGDGQEIEVYYYRPETVSRTLPVVFVMHGTNRDADRYRDEWAEIAEERDILVIVPEFNDEDYPGSAGYNLGNMVDPDTGEPNPIDQSPFAAIEPLFDYVRDQVSDETRDRYTIYGHSAGSQYVHRYIYFVPEARLDWAISANAGWYTMPDFETAWPYGLEGSGLDRDDLERALASRLFVLLGDQDIDPNHSSLRRAPEAMEQGPHRFARGQTFFAAGEAASGDAFGWQMGIVEGAAHSNSQMIEGALPFID